ncbi:MAG: hypothetical protein ACXWP4_11445, partial [Polyangiales bacterium]
LALGGILTVVVGTGRVSPATASEAGKVSPAPEDSQKQPNMQAAITDLEAAKDRLEKATPDKGGHRVKAIKLVKDAILEVKEGIKYDNEHQSKDEK